MTLFPFVLFLHALGAIVAPIAAGLLVDRGWEAGQVYCAFALPLLAAMASVRSLRV